MKTKIVGFALIFALLMALIVPVCVTTPAYADSPTTMGPIIMGIQTSGNTFVGIAATIQLKGTALTLANIKGFSLNSLVTTVKLVYDKAPSPGTNGAITGGTVSSLLGSKQLPKGTITTGGMYVDIGQMLGKPALVGNYVLLFLPFGNAPEQWGGLLLQNTGVLTILPQLITAMGGPDISGLMPTLNKIMGCVPINSLLQKHPIIILMPMSSMMMLIPLMM